MIEETEYIKPNVTIETELVGSERFYIYNYQGMHYRVFDSNVALNMFLSNESATWCFECDNELQLEKHLKSQAQ